MEGYELENKAFMSDTAQHVSRTFALHVVYETRTSVIDMFLYKIVKGSRECISAETNRHGGCLIYPSFTYKNSIQML